MNGRDREKHLLKNTGILAVGTICSKVVSFFLLPLYTAVLSTEDYGISDLIQTITYLLLPFVGLQLCAGVFRLTLERNSPEGKREVISTGVLVQLSMTAGFSLTVLLLGSAIYIPYRGIFVFYFASMLFGEIVTGVVRGLGRNGVYSFTGFLNTAIFIGLNLILILRLGWGGESILISLAVGTDVSGVVALLCVRFGDYFHIRSFSRKTCRELVRYSRSLIFNAVSWGIVNVSDRMLISWLLGVNENGIYAVANKIPVIYTTLFTAFDQAWVESLSLGADTENQEAYINEMLQKALKFLGSICLGIICCMSLIFKYLIGPDFAESYPHIFLLMLAVYVNSVCSLLGGIAIAYKDTAILSGSTVVGATANLIINLGLIRFVGLYAASLSTLLSYLLIMIVRQRGLKKHIHMQWPWRYIAELLAMTVLTAAGYFSRIFALNAVILVILLIWSILRNRETLRVILSTLRKKGIDTE